MHSSTAVGLKSWRRFRTVFGHRPGTKSGRQERCPSTTDTATEDELKNESEEDVEEEEKEETEEEEGVKDDDDDDCAEDERRNDEILGEDVSLLNNVPVERKKITQRVRRAISKPFLHETGLVACDGDDWSVCTYSDHRPPCTWDQPCATTSDPTPTCSEQTPPDRSEGNLSDATGDHRRRRSSGRLDEWSDYADGQWNLPLPKDSGDRSVQVCRIALPAANAAAAAAGVAHGRHLASARAQQQRLVLGPGPGSGPADNDDRCSTSGFFGEEISSSASSRSEPLEFNQPECSKNLIDFDSDEQEDLARHF